jgi:hypothetical protein
LKRERFTDAQMIAISKEQQHRNKFSLCGKSTVLAKPLFTVEKVSIAA